MEKINIKYKGKTIRTVTESEILDLEHKLKNNGDDTDLSSILGWIKHITNVYIPSKEQEVEGWTEQDSIDTILRFINSKIESCQDAILKDSKKELASENIFLKKNATKEEKKSERELIRSKFWYKTRDQKDKERHVYLKNKRRLK